MQIIDELEVNKRGPYGGGLGHVSFSGTMDMALGLRTMVIPTANEDSLYSYSGTNSRREWTVHLQVRRIVYHLCLPFHHVSVGRLLGHATTSGALQCYKPATLL